MNAGLTIRVDIRVIKLGLRLDRLGDSLSQAQQQGCRADLDAQRQETRFTRPEHAAARAAVVAWSRRLADIGARARDGEFPKARADLKNWLKTVAAELALLEAAAPTSLYNPEVLRRAKGG